MKHRDLFYDIAAPSTALNFAPNFGFYQNSHEKKTDWVQFGSHDLDGRNVLKHSALCFHEPFPEQYTDAWANAQRRYGPFYVDLDFKENPIKAVEETQKFVNHLLEIGVDQRGIHAFVSGAKGAYILVDSRLFGESSLAGHTHLGHIHLAMAKKLLSGYETVDWGVYKAQKKGRLIRTCNSRRDNGNYRAKIETISFTQMSPSEVLEKMKTQGTKIIYPTELLPNSYLSNIFDEALSIFSMSPQKKSKTMNIKPTSMKDATPENATPSDRSLPKCLESFNNGSFLSGESTHRFNDWSFLVASLVHLFNDEEAIQKTNGFLEKAPSQTYSSVEAKTNKLLEQIKSVRKTSPTAGPFCEAIRKNLKHSPCEQCPHFRKEISDLGQRFEQNTLGTFRLITLETGYTFRDPISNAAAILERMQYFYDYTGNRKNINYIYRIILEGNSFTFITSNDDLQNNDKLITALTLASGGIIRFNQNQKKPAVLLLQIGRVDGPLRDPQIKYSRIGFLHKTKFVFTNVIVENGLISFFSEPIVDSGEFSKTKNYFWKNTDLNDVSDIIKNFLESLLKIHETNVALPVLAFSLAVPLFPLLSYQKRFYLFIRGLTGDSKTTLALAAMSLWGDFSTPNSFFSAASTPNNLEVESASIGESLMLIDDIKLGHTNPTDFRRIIQNYADRVAKGRLRSDASINQGIAIDGHIIMTGEDDVFSNESSTKGRGLEIVIEKCFKDSKNFLHLQEMSVAMRGVLPHYFAYLQKQNHVAMNSEFQNAIQMYQTMITSGENKERISSNLAMLNISFKYFLHWTKNELHWTPELIESYQDAHNSALLKIGEQQSSAASEAACANLFINELKTLLGSEKVRLKTPYYHSDIPSLDKGIIVGELFQDHDSLGHVYIIPSISFQAVKESLDKQGTSFSFSLKAVAQTLERLGHIQIKDQGKLTKRRRSNRDNSNGTLGTNIEYWVFKKDLLGIDTTLDLERMTKPPLKKA